MYNMWQLVNLIYWTIKFNETLPIMMYIQILQNIGSTYLFNNKL